MKRTWVRHLSSFIGIGLFAVAVGIIHYKLRGYHYHDIARQFQQFPSRAVLAAVALTVLNYIVLTAYDALALRYIGHRLAYYKLAMASFIGYVFSNNATVLGGSAARYRIYSALGVSANDVAKLVLFCGLTFWLGFLSLGGVVFVLERQHVPHTFHLPFGSVWLVGVAFLAAVAVYFLLITVRRRPLKIRGWELSVPSVSLSAGQVSISSLDWLLAAGVLYVLLPAAMPMGFLKFLTIFMLAQAAGLLSYIPGGLGVFETVILILLADSGEASAITASLLLYRLIYYILPLIVAASLLAAHEILPQLGSVRRLGLHLSRWDEAIAPQVLAFAVFIAGAVLLFSGALPATKGRLGLLRDLLPLPAVEVSHLLGSLTGAALLILARGLQRRLNGAYYVTVVLLGAGIAFSLLKGLDYEEAAVLSIMLVALAPCRRAFYRRASFISERFSPGWMALIVIVLLCSVWVGLFSYRHVEYSSDLWWRFAFRDDAPRFLRATAGATMLVLLYALARLFVPAQPKPYASDIHMLEDVRRIVTSSEKTYASLALLGDKQFLLNDTRDAFIMYAIEGRSWIAMGDPVGPEDRWEHVAWDFAELCDQFDGQPVFYQIEEGHRDLYTDLGMTFLKLGEEARVSLPLFSLEGGGRKGLRYAHHRIAKQGYTFEVVPTEQVRSLCPALRGISDAWLKSKNTREKRFSLGFFQDEYIARSPVAVVRREGRIEAFTNLWTGARRQELSVDLMRYVPGCPEGIMDFLFVEVMLWGRREGYQQFNLGMAPLAGLESGTSGPLWSKAGTLVFRHGEHFYNFQGLRQYKQKFDPEWVPKYLACRGGLALPRILANVTTLISGGLAGVVKR